MKFRSMHWGIALCLLSACLWSACGDDEPNPGPVSARTKLVASQGGSAKSADGLLELMVWPGALSMDVTVIIETGVASPAQVATLGKLYRVRLEPPAATVTDARLIFSVTEAILGNTHPQYDLRVGHRLIQEGPFVEILRGEYETGSYTITTDSLFDFALIDEQIYSACECDSGTCGQGDCALPGVTCTDGYTPPPWNSDETCDGGSCASWSPTTSFTGLDAPNNHFVQPHVATDANGTPWVTYASAGSDDLDIFLVRLNTAGAVTFGPIQVNATDLDGQNEPRIAVREDGSGVVCWGSSSQAVGHNQGFARTFDPDGVLGPEREILMDGRSIWRPACAVHGDGYVAVGDRPNDAGNNSEIWATKLDSEGTPTGRSVRVSQRGDDYENDGTITRAELAVDQTGSVGVVWQRLFADGASVRFLNCDLRPLISEVDLGVLVIGDFASIASLGHGFLVAWSNPQTSTKSRIMGRLYDSGGRPTGADMQLTEDGAGRRVTPVASCLDASTCSFMWMTVEGDVSHKWLDPTSGSHSTEVTFVTDGQPNYLVSNSVTHYGAWVFWVKNRPDSGSFMLIRAVSVASP